MSPLTLALELLPTPIGQLMVVSDALGCLHLVEWRDAERRITMLLARRRELARARTVDATAPSRAAAMLAAYFAGDVAAIDRLACAPSGTAFQVRVWRELRAVPCGLTTTYGAIARRLGQPAAVRAVGLANAANPVSVVVPCHRVLGARGALTGYGGGIERKRWLLAHERAAAARLRSLSADLPLAAVG